MAQVTRQPARFNRRSSSRQRGSPGAFQRVVVSRSKREASMTTRVGTQPSNPGARTFVGRAKELSRLREALNDAGPVLCYVHGIAGVGKSAVLTEFARLARNEGATV